MGGWHYHRPSRFIWFTIGAFTASCFIKHREASHGAHGGHWGPFRHCSRSQIPQEAYGQPQRDPEFNRWEWRHGWQNNAPVAPATGAGAVTNAPPMEKNTPTPPPSPIPGSLPALQNDPWEEERQRLASVSQQASEMLAEFSEAGLDGLLGTMESLKAKIAERRAQREKEIRDLQELQAQREEKFRQFEEWRKQQELAAAKELPRRMV